ncbi:MAG TPA: branched-chain amino acid ABC transporter permease, partial [Actinomycetota bacterium]
MRRARPYLIAVALIALPPILGRVFPGQFNDLRAGILGFGVVFAIGALSLNLLMGYAGQISLGHGAFIGVGAIAMGIITGKLGLAFIIGLPVA